MPRHSPVVAGLFFLSLATLAACAGTTPTSPGLVGAAANFDAAFTVSPLDLAQVRTITPLGHIQPPGHVLPTDHVYFYQVDLDLPYMSASNVLPVYAPAR